MFYGCVNPQGESTGYNGMKLTQSEVTRAAVELVGKPVKMEHSGPPVGRILSSWENTDGKLMVVGQADEVDFAGKFTRNMMNSKQWGELSLSSSMPIDLSTMQTGEKRFNEISVVAKGLRDGTQIHRLEKETAGIEYNTPGKFSSTIQVDCSANMSASASAGGESSAMQTSGDSAAAAAADPALLNRILELERQNASLSSVGAGAGDAAPAGVGEGDGDPAGGMPGGPGGAAGGQVPPPPPSGASEEELSMYKKMVADKYKAAFSAATEQWLSNLPVEDPKAREAFTSNLKRMTDDPSIGGAGGHTVMDIVCACSKQHHELNNRLEATMQELNALKTAEVNQNGKRAKSVFSNASSREQPSAAADNSDPRAKAIESLQNHGVPMRETYDWLMSGMDQRSVGMDRVMLPKGRAAR